MTPAVFRFWKGWTQYGCVRACISAPPAAGVSTICCGRSWITPSTKPWRGYAHHVKVTLYNDCSASVQDDGRGMPVDIHPTMGVSGTEVIFTKLHAGGKFNNENYAYSGGLHGVGASVVNALSRWTTVDVFHDFKHYQARFESVTDPATGKITAGHTVQPLKQLGNTRQRGSLIRFLPDDRVFRDHPVQSRYRLPPSAGAGLSEQGTGHHLYRRAHPGKARSFHRSRRGRGGGKCRERRQRAPAHSDLPV